MACLDWIENSTGPTRTVVMSLEFYRVVDSRSERIYITLLPNLKDFGWPL